MFAGNQFIMPSVSAKVGFAQVLDFGKRFRGVFSELLQQKIERLGGKISTSGDWCTCNVEGMFLFCGNVVSGKATTHALPPENLPISFSHYCAWFGDLFRLLLYNSPWPCRNLNLSKLHYAPFRHVISVEYQPQCFCCVLLNWKCKKKKKTTTVKLCCS